MDAAKLLMKMQNLCARLDPDGVTDRPSNIEAAHDRLLSIFANDYRRVSMIYSMLVSSYVMRVFEADPLLSVHGTARLPILSTVMM